MSDHPISQQLDEIESALDTGSYQRGQWQRLLRRLDHSGQATVVSLGNQITTVSNKLHRHNNGFPELPVSYGFSLELILFGASLACLTTSSDLVQLLGVGLLALCLQPGIKIITGLILGVRYSYVYLWYFEPRFKMAFGTYLLLTHKQKVILHAMGSVGTPIALFIGFLTLTAAPVLAYLCLAGSLGALGMQVAAFVAAARGVKKIGPFQLTTLTTPATLAYELKKAKQPATLMNP